MKTSSEILTTRYGGIIPVVQEMIKRGIPELIDSHLDAEFRRKHNSKYKFSDMFISWIAAALCGATRIDHVTGLKKDLEVIPNLTVPSHDTVGRLMKEIVAPIEKVEKVTDERVNLNEIDDNLCLNRLLIQCTKLMGALKEDEEYILDVDCTFIQTRCSGAKSAAAKDRLGFYPMICLIGNLPVFISMRNGNSSANFRIKECIETCLSLLDEVGIKISKVRTDGVGYDRALMTMLNNMQTKYVTASPVNFTFKKMFDAFDNSTWREVTIETANEFKECHIAEIDYTLYQQKEACRIIALKVPGEQKLDEQLSDEERIQRLSLKDKMRKLKSEGKLKSGNKRYAESFWQEVKGFKYKMIATNDFDTPAEELMLMYNQRGDAERQFSFMKNDFGWKLPPFINMNENTVFFIVSAMANNVFRAVAEIFNEHIDELELNARVRRFQKAFIDTIAICMNGNWTYYNTKIDFEKIA